MDTNKLIALIDVALAEADSYVASYYNGDEKPMADTKKVLHLLKEEIKQPPEHINERVLRGMHDIGMASFKEYENTPLENAINNVTAILYNEIPHYRKLEPLRMDFGRGNPI